MDQNSNSNDDESRANDEPISDRPADDGEAKAKPSFTFKKDDDADEESEGKSRWLRETVIIVGIVLALMFVFTQFFFRQYVVPSESMEPTLIGCAGCSNDRIVVDKMVYRFSDPEPGDVVVFKAPTSSWDGMWTSPRSSNPVIHKVQDVLSLFALAPPDENNLVKRVIAVGGQTVQCREADGKGVTVDGKPLHEPYVDKNLQAQNFQMSDGTLGAGSCYGDDFGPIKVPDGNVWVTGDNRSNSADSRAHIDDELHGTVPVSDIRGKVRTVIYPFSRIGGVGSVNPQG
ncbi:signal peptidase I [Gordonia phthalatica]|uniref:Signal peptidase I n=1 Tax=Gordonia phthalatica TaxID=1136941 RepID=A0A0N9NL05_9ACTN|nr:signal peptidase I [Gordonia phthalatica]ALG86724.1 signal peptidase [Gordonia phthalatica]